ncbi:hypothetical protein PanWU01x14_348860 [Parasponia andersonii]|uniref:Uncharacterized protein n=1 Tax=Parasponia andersonii TaxID=3476 RepID=A0A2P5ABL8_PARAD|nr:hypothetical protein PanWU01x14_348860 [Parasponia andersonii]
MFSPHKMKFNEVNGLLQGILTTLGMFDLLPLLKADVATPKLRRHSPAAADVCIVGNLQRGRIGFFVAGDDSGYYSTSNRSRWIRLVSRIIKLVFRKRIIEGLKLGPDPPGYRQRYLKDSIAWYCYSSEFYIARVIGSYMSTVLASWVTVWCCVPHRRFGRRHTGVPSGYGLRYQVMSNAISVIKRSKRSSGLQLVAMPPRRVLRYQPGAEPPRPDFTHLIEDSLMVDQKLSRILLDCVRWRGTFEPLAQYANEDQQDEVVNRFETLTQCNRTELSESDIFNRIGTQTFHTLPEIAVAAQRVEAIEESLDYRRNQGRGNDKKATRRNQGQWSAQGTSNSGSSNSSGCSGGSRGSPENRRGASPVLFLIRTLKRGRNSYRVLRRLLLLLGLISISQARILKLHHRDEEDPARGESKRASTVVVTSFDRDVKKNLPKAETSWEHEDALWQFKDHIEWFKIDSTTWML